jgi:hypothetical protein
MKSNETIDPRVAGESVGQAPAFEIIGAGVTCTTDGVCQVEDLGEVAAEVAETPSSEKRSASAETAATAEPAAAKVSDSTDKTEKSS